MGSTAKASSAVALVRSAPPREPAVREAQVARVGSAETEDPGLTDLVVRWKAPVMPEEEIDAWATRYRLCPKSRMTFVEYLVARGVGEIV